MGIYELWGLAWHRWQLFWTGIIDPSNARIHFPAYAFAFKCAPVNANIIFLREDCGTLARRGNGRDRIGEGRAG